MRDEIDRRFVHMMLLLLAAPRAAIGGPTSCGALAMIGWCAMALALQPRVERIPRAVVYRSPRARLRAFADGVLASFGAVPVAYGWRSTRLPPLAKLAALDVDLTRSSQGARSADRSWHRGCSPD